MNIDLSEQELALVREVVEHDLSHLRLEIRHTDHREFRTILLQREALIESALHKLVEVSASSTAT